MPNEHAADQPTADRVGDFLAGLAGRPPDKTHFSEVFVGADTVWKRKLRVRLPFVDLTTDAERHRVLARELELNQPHAPGLYRDLVAVVEQQGGQLGFTDAPREDAALEWVLRMASVPPNDFLARRAALGKVDVPLQIALADMVAALHAGFPPVQGWDSHFALRRVITGNAEAAVDAGLSADAVGAWQAGCEAALQRLSPWLSARSAAGYVRRAHGDLHLGNICIWDGQVVPFDALEFDEALATIDLAYDLAFLLMDLEHRVDRAAANRVMNRTIARTGDAGLTAGLPLFLSLRAMVRAHVSSRSNQPEEGATYLQAARDYLTPGKPLVLAIGGLPGTGKSTVARALAPGLGSAPGAVVIRSDEVRKRLHRVPPEQRLPPEAYAAEANARTNAALREAVMLAASGRSRGDRRCDVPRCGATGSFGGRMRDGWNRFSRDLARGPVGNTPRARPRPTGRCLGCDRGSITKRQRHRRNYVEPYQNLNWTFLLSILYQEEKLLF